MKHLVPLTAAAIALVLAPSSPALAEDEGIWKRGRIYYRSVCTACHEVEIGHSIAPAEKTIAEWNAWIETEEGAAHLGQYVSQDYRNELAPDNKVAASFASLSDTEMWNDVRAFVIYGAKDSANPATCN